MAARSQRYSQTEDFRVFQALEEIEATYSVQALIKPKSILKFGRTTNADANTKVTVARFPSGLQNEFFSTGNFIDSIISDSTADVGKAVNIEGHYRDTNFNLVFNTQAPTLNGQTAVSLASTGQALTRGTRLQNRKGTFLSPATTFVGNIYLYASTETTGVVGGVPQTPSAVKCMINAGNQQSEKCATALSYRDFWLVTAVYAAIDRNSGANTDVAIDVEYRETGGVWLPLGLEMQLRRDVLHKDRIEFDPLPIIPRNSDVRLTAIATANDTIVSGHIHGYLALAQTTVEPALALAA